MEITPAALAKGIFAIGAIHVGSAGKKVILAIRFTFCLQISAPAAIGPLCFIFPRSMAMQAICMQARWA